MTWKTWTLVGAVAGIPSSCPRSHHPRKMHSSVHVVAGQRWVGSMGLPFPVKHPVFEKSPRSTIYDSASCLRWGLVQHMQGTVMVGKLEPKRRWQGTCRARGKGAGGSVFRDISRMIWHRNGVFGMDLEPHEHDDFRIG